MLLEWWNDIVQWIKSPAGWSVVTDAILPFIAILAAGIIAALIARGAIRRLINQQDRQHKAAAIATLLASARKIATWSTLTAADKQHAELQASEAEIRIRLLPLLGSSMAAEWAKHHLNTMKRNSANYSFQADQDLATLEDGLIEWQAKPSRAKKLFAADLAAWKYDDGSEDDLSAKQREWSASQTETVNLQAAS